MNDLLLCLCLLCVFLSSSTYSFDVNPVFDHIEPAFVPFPLRGSSNHNLASIGVSAYMDHRHVIRGIAEVPHVALNLLMATRTNQTLMSNVKCVFYSQKQKHAYYSTSATFFFLAKIAMGNHMCSVGSKCFISAEDYRSHPPDFVTLVYSSQDSTLAAAEHITTGTQWLKVQNQQIPAYSEIFNTNNSKSAEKPRAALCSAPLRGDLYAQSMYEWLVYNVEVMHFTRIILYNHQMGNNTVAVIKQVAQYYADRNVSIELYTWHVPAMCHEVQSRFGGNVSAALHCTKRNAPSVHYYAQTSQEQDCVHRALQTHRWIASFDVDEYFDIHPQNEFKNAPDIIYHGLQKNPHTLVFHFSNVFFSINCTAVNETLRRQLESLEKNSLVPRSMMPATFSVQRAPAAAKAFWRSKLINDGLFLVNTYIHHAEFEDFATSMHTNTTKNRVYKLHPETEAVLHHVRHGPTLCPAPPGEKQPLYQPIGREQAWIFDQYGELLAARIAPIRKQ